ncbi:MAG: hypothetical protein ABIT69_06830 [Sphingomicrobium sp.]
MFLKKLKPIHGWRMFFGEVAIIVLGVGIALVAQQLVEDWTWRTDVAQARRQLIAETHDNFTYAAERLAAQPCIDAQLDRLVARAVAQGERLQPAAPIESSMGTVAVRQPSRPYRDDAWTSVVGDGVSAHFPGDERDLLASNYTQVRALMERSTSGDDTNDRLNLFLNPIALDPQVRAGMVEQAMAAKTNNRRMTLVAGQIMSSFWALGLAPTADKVDRYLSYSGTIKYCRQAGLPLGDWRQLLSAQRAADLTTDRAAAFYRAHHHRR